MNDLEDIPVDPDEATDLRLHVRNCMKRHVALVKMISREKVFTWVYRALVLPGVGYLVFKLATIPPDVLALIAD